VSIRRRNDDGDRRTGYAVALIFLLACILLALYVATATGMVKW
jgi:hypothetical protein